MRREKRGRRERKIESKIKSEEGEVELKVRSESKWEERELSESLSPLSRRVLSTASLCVTIRHIWYCISSDLNHFLQIDVCSLAAKGPHHGLVRDDGFHWSLHHGLFWAVTLLPLRERLPSHGL
jgi:hypothetical protein